MVHKIAIFQNDNVLNAASQAVSTLLPKVRATLTESELSKIPLCKQNHSHVLLFVNETRLHSLTNILRFLTEIKLKRIS